MLVQFLSRIAAVATMATVAASAGATLGTPAFAHADGSVSCAAAGPMQFAPGVTFAPQSQNITYVAGGACNDTSGTGVKSFTFTANFQDTTVSCVAGGIVPGGTGSGKIDWTLEDGSTLTSTVDVQIERTVLWTITLKGTVTDGQFDGKTVGGELTTSPLQGTQCFTGLKQVHASGRISVA